MVGDPNAWSDAVRLKVIASAAVDMEVSDMSVDLPGAPGPLFSARRFAVSGPMVSARQATTHAAPAPPPLPLLVGHRRAAPFKVGYYSS